MRLFARGWEHPEGVLAEYLWGRSTLLVSPDSPLARDLYSKTIASLIAGKLPIDSDADFRLFVALLHELCHCLQDLTTGLGMSDLLCRMEFLPRALEAGRDASYGEEWQNRFATLGGLYQRRSFVNTSGWGADHELDLLQRKLGGIANDVSLFRAVTLLEVEAELSANQIIVSLGGSAEQIDIARRNAGIYSPMSSPYAETITELLFGLLTNDSPSRQEVHQTLERIDRLAAVWLDLSFAVPPPAFLEERGLDADDFHPGVRFYRMFQEYLRQPAIPDDEQVALRAAGALYPLIEERCRKTQHFEYPPVKEIYEAWADEFDQLAWATTNFRATATWMANLCRRRTRLDYRVWSRSPFEILQLEVPFQIRAGNVKDVLNLFGHAMTDEGKLQYLEAHARAVYEAMMHFMLGMQSSLICPRALEEGGCPVQTARCFSGISRLSMVPEDEECLVRRQLDAAAWNDRALIPEDGPPWA